MSKEKEIICSGCGKKLDLKSDGLAAVQLPNDSYICMKCCNDLGEIARSSLGKGENLDEDEYDDEDYDEEEFDYAYTSGKKKNDSKYTVTKLIKPKEIKEKLDRSVVGQERAKKIISVAIYNHYKRFMHNREDIQKSNVLMIGPSGVGKTEIARTVAKSLGVPFVICDATTVTEAGYVGDDVENMLLRLIQAADMDIELAEKGIIYIDEIDKIARKGESTSITRDVSGEGVQQALLKIVEGAEVDVQLSGGRKHPYGERVRIDTSNILFICGGAFEGITMNNKKERSIGFGKEEVLEEVEVNNEVTAKELEKQGMIPELVGRLPIRTRLEVLTKDDLKKILTDVDNSIIKQYTDLIELDSVRLNFSEEAIDLIAEKAVQNKTGARGLKSVIEQFMTDIMFEIPSNDDIESIDIVVKNNELSHIENKKKASA